VTRAAPRLPRRAGEEGSALVEFVLVGVALLVPLVYLVMYAASGQRTAFAVTGAVRDAGRAYTAAGSDAEGRARAALAARLALAGAHVDAAPDALVIACAPQPCSFAPGSRVTVRLRVDVPLLGLGVVPVRAHHTERPACHSAGAPAAGAC